MNYKTDDLRIESIKPVISPAVITEEIRITKEAAKTTALTRNAIHDILHGEDDRLIVITGPCSIHDIDAAKEYANKLKPLIDEYSDDLLIIMRVYFEKPRTTVGWKGLINDPDLDDSYNINKGLHLARQLLLDFNNMGIPAATEYLDLITPQYVTDLISWGAIGARTTESQVHRELASGLSCPVGFKNGTYGTTKIAVDAIGAAIRPHNFLSVTKEGNAAIFNTTGNPDVHMILRGGQEPNYDKENIDKVCKEMESAKLTANIMIDLSHANSKKQHDLQIEVGNNVAEQVANGDKRIIGAMIESHLVAGRQDAKPGQELVYGQSITDACLGWDHTVELIKTLATASKARRNK
ncbi:MAG TPA: 3-deoxy-7-phosphoheptulonate synthase [Thiotrichaceae bacterium]|jgi:3-deoxy-7-phosphoheptulonate synthase|nr:3-deoxy-7-phosphoheptulonate synthase [Thiotrichaceae bacterium]HIM08868.1 3-deoxy-7-phosphoheptulonate synthase [Gammaproteobacteria bacterium]